ncbi:hypothetical protein RRG08_044319 [Elysia crispata]|uniref:Uncharacterized protein n=1 Tax=Elysia crispata TaxID=231223 RepID=A0AAE0ZCC0_9GAST|nr:hypothetical protein RRG08_044319 [Elysia crispata]
MIDETVTPYRCVLACDSSNKNTSGNEKRPAIRLLLREHAVAVANLQCVCLVLTQCCTLRSDVAAVDDSSLLGQATRSLSWLH